MAPLGKYSRAPSPYPWLLFHGIRLGQFISSTLVLGFLAFFVHLLLVDRYYVPWTFITLLSVASFTNLSVLVTAFFYHYRTLTPRPSAMVNSFLCFLWMLGFALLTWNLSGTLGSTCNVENWNHETGVMVCRIYKALETFSLVGMLFTIASLLLDLYIVRSIRSRGVYGQMGSDVKRGYGHPSPRHQHDRSVSVADDFSMRDHGDEEIAASPNDPSYRHPAGLAAPQDSHNAPFRAQPLDMEHFGYNHPEENTAYEGAHTRMLDRQFADHE